MLPGSGLGWLAVAAGKDLRWQFVPATPDLLLFPFEMVLDLRDKLGIVVGLMMLMFVGGPSSMYLHGTLF